MLQRLKKKGIIYEITLHDWDIRDDIEHDGTCVKIVTKRSKGAFDKPNGIDEVTINLKVYQEKEVIIHELTNFTGMLDDPQITPSIKKVLETMRDGEISRGEIQPKFYLEKDIEAVSLYGLDTSKPLLFDIELIKFDTIIDWYLDKTAFKRVYR